MKVIAQARLKARPIDLSAKTNIQDIPSGQLNTQPLVFFLVIYLHLNTNQAVYRAQNKTLQLNWYLINLLSFAAR